MPKPHILLAMTSFLLLSSLFIVSGVALFYLKTDFTIVGLQKYYRPDLFDATASAKSFFGLMKVAVPHMLAMALFWFVISHFLLFIQSIGEKAKLRLAGSVGLSVLSYNATPFLITFHDVRWAYLMFALGVIFQLGLCAMIYIVFADALKSISMATEVDKKIGFPGLDPLAVVKNQKRPNL